MNANAATRIESKPFGKTAAGEPVELFTFTRAGAPTVAITNLGGHIVSILAPDRDGKVGRRHARLRGLRRLPGRHVVLRQPRRPLRQPHREGPLHPRREDLHARDEQRAELAPRRAHRLPEAALGGEGGERARGRRARADLRQQGRRGGLPGHPHREGRLLAAGRRRPRDRLHGHDRRAHGRQPHEPRLLQPGRRGRGHDPRPRDADRGRRLHAGGRDAHPDGREAARSRARPSTSASPSRSARASTRPTSS